MREGWGRGDQLSSQALAEITSSNFNHQWDNDAQIPAVVHNIVLVLKKSLKRCDTDVMQYFFFFVFKYDSLYKKKDQ